MSQPPYQPPPQPGQQPWPGQQGQPAQNPYNPYNPHNPYAQPATPQVQQQPYGAQPFGQQTNVGDGGGSGNPVGAIFLGLFASVVVSLLYSGLILATYKDQSITTANILYLAHALANGAVVGLLVGSVARRNTGARIGAAIIAALGAFFGYANALPLIFAWEQTPKAAFDLFSAEPFLPAKTWWNDEASGGIDWFSPLGLLLAAAAAVGLAYAMGNRRRRP